MNEIRFYQAGLPVDTRYFEYRRGSTIRDPSQLIGGEYSGSYMTFLSVQYSPKF